MKKFKLHTLFYIISAVLIIAFLTYTTINYLNYDESYSTPFYVYIMMNFLVFVIPSIISFIVGKILNKKTQKESKWDHGQTIKIC